MAGSKRDQCRDAQMSTSIATTATPELLATEPETQPVKPARTDEMVLQLSTDELVQMAPRLRAYLATPVSTWRDVVNAADRLRGELRVSKSLWGEACLVLGREEAAIAVAIVSAKPPRHVRASPGGYFQGMVTKAQAGELNLARTIWGLRTRVKQVGKAARHGG